MDRQPKTAVIVVTGAASGIGRASAEHAVASGAKRLVLSDANGQGLESVAERLRNCADVVCAPGDLADPLVCQSVIDQAIEAFGRVDGLVNAAGLTTRCTMTDGTVALWDRLFSVNTRAPYLLMQAVIRDMLQRGESGAIVNIQSVNAHCGAPDLAIYSATKGALQTLTANAANAHLKDGIRVNGINLGWALTEAEDHLQQGLSGDKNWAVNAGAALPLGRLLMPEDAARLAVHLLSPASAPLTGASIDLDQRPLGAPN